MMKTLLIVLLFCGPAWANTCTLAAGAYATLAATAGHWTGTGCTGGAYVAGNGDTADISAATLIVAAGETWTIGASTGTGTTAAVTFGNTATLTINTGTVVMRGDMSFGGSVSTNALINNAGTFRWDNSLAAGGTLYQVVNGASGIRPVVGQGSAGTCTYSAASHVFSGAGCAVFTSNVSGAGNFGHAANTFEGSFICDYCAISNIGDAANDAIYARSFAGSIIHLTHSSLRNCGRVHGLGFTDYLLTNTEFSAGLSTEDLNVQDAAQASTKQITNVVFGLAPNISQMTTWTVSENYVGSQPVAFFDAAAANDAAATTFKENFVRFLNISSQIALPFTSIASQYVFVDLTAADNPHIFGTGKITGTSTISGSVVESPDDVTTDTGEASAITANPTAPLTMLIASTIVLPSKTQKQTMEITSLLGNISAPNLTYSFSHDLSLIGSGGTNNSVQVDENGAAASRIGIMKDSIFADVTGNAATAVKLLTLNLAAPTTDIVSPANADYNAGSNLKTTTTCANCTNQGNGYSSKFTSTPGQHDIDVVLGQANVLPKFISTHRRLATWDTQGTPANAVCTAWAVTTVYSAGDCVSVQNGAGTYQNDAINYIALSGHTSAAGTKPDSGATWRTVWEYRSLQDLRGSIVSGTGKPVLELIQWVRRGWTPQNPVYWNAGSDGSSIGATQPVVFPVPGSMRVAVN